MIYKAKENAATDSESRKKEDDKINEIFLSSIDMEYKQIMKTIRLGRKTDEDINRPLLISFNTEQDLIEIKRNLPKLKKTTAKIRNLRISPDRSLNKREDVLNLVTKVKKLQRSGRRKLCVSGSKNADTKFKEERKTRKLNFWYTNIDTITKTQH